MGCNPEQKEELMKQYKLFEHPDSRIEVVKQGWSWPAFIFTGFWALVKKMWSLGIGILAAVFVVSFIGNVAGGETKTILDGLIGIAGLVVSIVLGVNGNKWRENNLLSRGYETKETLSASNPEGAAALYLKQKSTAGQKVLRSLNQVGNI